jgi:NitT/TauT family transport system permease protein
MSTFTSKKIQVRVWQFAITTLGLIVWQLFSQSKNIAFFIGEPLQVFHQLKQWLFVDADVYHHLGITILETGLAFFIGTIGGTLSGLFLGLSPIASAILDPYIKAFNAMPRVILAPIFAVWFGLGIWSKVALAVTLVFFVVFFNVYQGIKEVNQVILANARMLGASQRQLLKTVYLPSATSWVFSSLHTSIGLAFVGSVVGEYLGSAAGVGYLILQAEGTFDINAVIAGIILLTICALLLDSLVNWIEKRFMVWRPPVVSGETL